MSNRETIYLYNGALLDADGDCAMPIPHLFSSVNEPQEWADDKEMTIRVVRGVRRGDALVEKPSKHCSCTVFGRNRQQLPFGVHMHGCPLEGGLA